MNMVGFRKIAVCVAVVLISLAAYGSGQVMAYGPSANQMRQMIVGAWYVNPPMFDEWFVGGETLSFFADGTGLESFEGIEFAFEWRVEYIEHEYQNLILRLFYDLGFEIARYPQMWDGELDLFMDAGPPLMLTWISNGDPPSIFDLWDDSEPERDIPGTVLEEDEARRLAQLWEGRISAGFASSLAVMEDDSLWMCGRTESVHFMDVVHLYSPGRVMDNVATVAAGTSHTMVITNDGALWAFGNNGMGRLGDGTSVNTAVPVHIMDDVVAVAGGFQHSLAVTADGGLWTWGGGAFGRLGSYVDWARYYPERVMDDVVAVAAGDFHSLALTSDGLLWAFGGNTRGQLGDGRTEYRIVPVPVFDDVVAIAAAGYMSMALTSDGELWAWGDNRAGQLGDGTTTDSSIPVHIMDDVIAMAGGGHHILAITSTGGLWAIGSNGQGRLGDGSITNHNTPIHIMNGVVAVAAGSGHSLAVTYDGVLWAWGDNREGQIGDGTNTERHTPTHVKWLILHGIDESLLGEWTLTESTEITAVQLRIWDVTYTFNEDGTAVWSIVAQGQTIEEDVHQWSGDGEIFLIDGEQHEFTLDGDTLTISRDDVVMVFLRSRD